MNKDLLDVELLDRVQYSIEENICSYEIEEIEDIFNEDKGEVQRCITRTCYGCCEYFNQIRKVSALKTK